MNNLSIDINKTAILSHWIENIIEQRKKKSCWEFEEFTHL